MGLHFFKNIAKMVVSYFTGFSKKMEYVLGFHFCYGLRCRTYFSKHGVWHNFLNFATAMLFRDYHETFYTLRSNPARRFPSFISTHAVQYYLASPPSKYSASSFMACGSFSLKIIPNTARTSGPAKKICQKNAIGKFKAVV